MIVSLARDPLSYFRSYRNYFVIIYVAFLAYPLQALALISSTNPGVIRLATQMMIVAAASIATVWGFVVTRLYVFPDRFPISSVITNLKRPISLAYSLYLCLMGVTVSIGFGDPNSVSADEGKTAFYFISGGNFRAVGFSFEILIFGSLLAVAFTLYPSMALAHLRARLKDRDVRDALRIIASCFVVISMLLLSSEIVLSLGYGVLAIANFGSVILLIVVVHAFRKPSFLKSFLGLVPALDALPTGTRSNQIVVIYGPRDDKLGPLSRYIGEAVGQGERLFYFHNEDEASLSERLSLQGVDVSKHFSKGNLQLFPLSNLYSTKSRLDTPAVIDSCRHFENEARALGRKGFRIIIDFADSVGRPLRELVEHITDPGWASPDGYTRVLMAFDDSVFQGNEGSLALVRRKVPVLLLSESIDFFAKTVGLSHSEIAGKKILLEYDPLSEYEKVVKSLLAEAASNFERTVVFTRKDSPLYGSMEEPGLKMFVLTSRVSYPKVESENHVLVPAYDSSLILDALNRTIEAYAGTSITILFDNVSHYVFALGIDRTYSLIRQALELMVSNRLTAVFLMNSAAHDQKSLSLFEGLFDLEMICSVEETSPKLRTGPLI